MKLWMVALVLGFTMPVTAQNLTGTWVGYTISYDYVRLEIIHAGDSVYGMAYDEGGGGFCKTDFMGAYNKRKKNLQGTTVHFIARTENHALTDYDMFYQKKGKVEYLNGFTGLKSALSKGLPFAVNIPTLLRKENDKVDTTAFMRKYVIPAIPVQLPRVDTPALVIIDTPVITNPVTPKPVITIRDSMLQVKEHRSSPVIADISTSADSVQLFLYDEGVVDGDSITVFVNNVMLLNNFMLTARPGELKIPVTKNQPVEVVLVANNLGSIPPNTALIVVVAGTVRHEVRAAYDLNANARILIRYKE